MSESTQIRTPSAPKGTYDLLPPRSEAFARVTDALSDAARRAGYGFVSTPMFEETALFRRGVGESTDVVSKEMYTFEDRGGRSLTLRPEGTAGVMRAIVEHRLLNGPLPVKLWYTGPNFRYEQPQSGRYRQHVQVGIEAVGVDDPALDAEVVAVADEGFRRLGLADYELHLTSLGCFECRPAYRELLVEFLDRLDLDEATRARARGEPAAGAGRQASGGPRPARGRAAAPRPPVRRVRRALCDGSRACWSRWASTTCTTRTSCADWTTTPARPSSSSTASSGRRPRSVGAGATTA